MSKLSELIGILRCPICLGGLAGETSCVEMFGDG